MRANGSAFGASAQRIVYVADFAGKAIGIFPAGVLAPKQIGKITKGITTPRDLYVDRKRTLYVLKGGTATF